MAAPSVATIVAREQPAALECRLAIRVQPRARANEVAGVVGDTIKIRLTAPPVDGAANDALITFLAGRLGLARSALRIVSGEHARDKVVSIQGCDADTVRRRLT